MGQRHVLVAILRRRSSHLGLERTDESGWLEGGKSRNSGYVPWRKTDMTRETFCSDCGMTLAGPCSHPRCPKRPKPKENLMDNAPKDGTRILVKCHVYFYGRRTGRQERSGTRIVECWFTHGAWQKWCGSQDRLSTEYINPISWCPVPEELK